MMNCEKVKNTIDYNTYKLDLLKDHMFNYAS